MAMAVLRQGRQVLEPGQRLTIAAGVVHRVGGEGGTACRFLNVHAGGAYDFRASPG